MNKTIFVAGNSHGEIPEIALEKAFELGKCIAKGGYTLITGGTLGTPEKAVLGCIENKGLSVAISPAVNLQEHIEKYHQSDKSDVYIYTGGGDMGRNIFNIRSADAVIVVGGGMGTLCEFTMAFAEGKRIGILTGTGGITSQIKKIISATKKKPKNMIVFSSNPKTLLKKLFENK